MRALAIDRYGGPEVLRLQDLPPPALGDDDVLIDVHAAGVNPLDFKIRAGLLKRIRSDRFPLILGNELSGVVANTGRNVKSFKVGDEVFARVDKQRLGAFADQAAVPQSHVAPKPANLSHVQAASVPLVALTAWQALVEYAEVRPGQKVLVHAGAGGVGSFAIQLAASLGAQVATTASPANHDFVRRLGADVVVDYTSRSFENELSGYDAVLDTVGASTLLKSFRVLKPGGMVVSIAAAVPDVPTARSQGVNPLLMPALKVLNLKTTHAARKHKAFYRYLLMRADGALLAEIGRQFEAGSFVTLVEQIFPLEQGPQALARQETGRVRGKLVLALR
jgi:NADPH:quinone reductase-like Zn-dependent oxidoreductase